MSATQLTIALAAAALINQWAIAIFNKRAKQARPKTKPVSSVAAKAKRSFWQYLALGVDLVLLIVAIYIMRDVISLDRPNVTPTLEITVKISLLISLLVVMIGYQAHKAFYGALALFFP